MWGSSFAIVGGMLKNTIQFLGPMLVGAFALGCGADRGESIEVTDDAVLDVLAPSGGAAWKLAGLPLVRLTVVDPNSGLNGHTFMLEAGPACALTHTSSGGTVTSRYDCNVSGGPWSALHVVADVMYRDGPWGTDANVSLVSLPVLAAVAGLGLEIRLLDTAEREHVVYTSYSGGYQIDEPATAAGGPTPMRMDQSVQAIPYWADDGSALLVWAADPSGEEPKDIVGRPLPGSPATLALGWDAIAPDSHVGGRPFAVPFPIRFTRHGGDWYDAAKLYRAWLETEATDQGEILELGRIEQRADVSRFVKELDLIGVNNTMWYQGTPAHQQNLRSLARLPDPLGADDVMYMFWGTSDPADPYGRPGTWLPYKTLPSDTAVLLGTGVRSMLYTMPQVWSDQNPALAETGAWQHLSEDRTGQPLRFPWDPPDVVYGDTASTFWTTFFEQLAAGHASTFSGVHGFYTDNPYAITDDFVRPSGSPLGFTKSAYTGLCEINRAIRRGGTAGGGEFMTIHESGTERLIRCTDMEAASGLLTRIYAPFYTADLPRAFFVPFFQAVFGGYTMLASGDVRFGTSTLAYGLWGNTLVESFENMARAQAASFALGSMATWSELYLSSGILTPEWTSKELLGGDPAVIVAPFVSHVAALIRARDRARPWLAHGEMLRDPAVGGDRVTMRLLSPYPPHSPEPYDMPKVATGAFRAADTTVRIVAANGGRDAAVVVLDLAKVGLATATLLTDPIASVSFSGSKGTFSITVPASAAWVLEPS